MNAQLLECAATMQLFCSYLAHHELESVLTIMIIINAAKNQEGPVLCVTPVCLHATCQKQGEELPWPWHTTQGLDSESVRIQTCDHLRLDSSRA